MIQNKRFDYLFTTVGDLAVETATDEKTGRRSPSNVLVNDEPVQPTDRFWTSLYARYGFNKSFFKYFTYDEVFQRIATVNSSDRMRLCIERDVLSGENRLLAATNPAKPVVRHDELMTTLHRYDGKSISYNDGVVESSHVPRTGANFFDISGDAFRNQFVISTPIDGYGLPSIYISLLREICSNGMVGYSKSFRSSLALGRGEDDVSYSIVRALDGFGNDEGYAAIRQRFEAATKSWASVQEASSLYKLVVKLLSHDHIQLTGGTDSGISRLLQPVLGAPLHANNDAATTSTFSNPVLSAFHQMTGDVSEIYGLANVDALSSKRQKTLPVSCTVYDMLNFVSEIATHHSTDYGSRTSQAWLGTLISNEYDLENSCDSFGEFQDFFVERCGADDV